MFSHGSLARTSVHGSYTHCAFFFINASFFSFLRPALTPTPVRSSYCPSYCTFFQRSLLYLLSTLPCILYSPFHHIRLLHKKKPRRSEAPPLVVCVDDSCHYAVIEEDEDRAYYPLAVVRNVRKELSVIVR